MTKLVREIRDIVMQTRQHPVGYFSKKHELKHFLAEKLVEEAKEFEADHIEEELADVQEVIAAIYEVFEFSKEQIKKIQAKKRAAHGEFKTGYVLDDVQKQPVT